MCRKIRCDRKSWKLFEFRGELNMALDSSKFFLEIEQIFLD